MTPPITFKAKLTVLLPQDEEGPVRIEIDDADAAVRFLELEVPTVAFVAALGRLAMVRCVASARHLGIVGKRLEHKQLVFEMPEHVGYNERKGKAAELATKHCPKGWVPDLYFGSQDSFFQKDGKDCAQTTIRRWVPKKDASKEE